MFHIIKRTRVYEGRPYCGPASENIPAECATLDAAKQVCTLLNARNPVGWSIYNSKTGLRVCEMSQLDPVDKLTLACIAKIQDRWVWSFMTPDYDVLEWHPYNPYILQCPENPDFVGPINESVNARRRELLRTALEEMLVDLSRNS